MSLNKNAGTALIGLGILTIGGYAALTYLGSQKEKEAEFERTKQEEYADNGWFENVKRFFFGSPDDKKDAKPQSPNNTNPVKSEEDYLSMINKIVIAAQNKITQDQYNLTHINDIGSEDVMVTYAANGRIDTILDTKEHVLYDTKSSITAEGKASMYTWEQLYEQFSKNTPASASTTQAPIASYMK